MTSTAVVKYNGPKMPTYDAACSAIAQCARVDEVKSWQDLGAAAQAYARQARDQQMFTDATKIRMRAQRRAGEILIKMKETGERHSVGTVAGHKHIGGNKGHGRRGSVKLHPITILTPPKISDLGLSKKQASEWQSLAKITENQFEEKIAVAAGLKRHKPRKRRPRGPVIDIIANDMSVEEKSYWNLHNFTSAVDAHFPCLTKSDLAKARALVNEWKPN